MGCGVTGSDGVGSSETSIEAMLGRIRFQEGAPALGAYFNPERYLAGFDLDTDLDDEEIYESLLETRAGAALPRPYLTALQVALHDHRFVPPLADLQASWYWSSADLGVLVTELDAATVRTQLEGLGATFTEEPGADGTVFGPDPDGDPTPDGPGGPFRDPFGGRPILVTDEGLVITGGVERGAILASVDDDAVVRRDGARNIAAELDRAEAFEALVVVEGSGGSGEFGDWVSAALAASADDREQTGHLLFWYRDAAAARAAAAGVEEFLTNRNGCTGPPTVEVDGRLLSATCAAGQLWASLMVRSVDLLLE